jgi:hypothetical protein
MAEASFRQPQQNQQQSAKTPPSNAPQKGKGGNANEKQ